LALARGELAALSEGVAVPVENLVSPELVRRLCWDWDVSGGDDVEEYLHGRFAERGARAWQRALTAPPLAKALTAANCSAPSGLRAIYFRRCRVLDITSGQPQRARAPRRTSYARRAGPASWAGGAPPRAAPGRRAPRSA